MIYGCCTGIDKYNDLVRLGYDFIELAGTDIYNMTDSEFDNAKSVILNGPIGCLRVNAFMPGDIKVVGDNVDRDRIREYVDKVLFRASGLGVETIGFGSPGSRNVPGGFDRERAVEQVVEFLKIAAERAEKYGIKILVEAVTKEFTNFINTLDEALEIVKQVDSQYVRMMIDLYHFWMENEDINAINDETVKHSLHVHIAEKRGRAFLVPSSMELYKSYIKKLKDLGYDGTVSIEGDSVNFIAEADESIKILREIG